jgi:hypothetical protein
MSYRKQVSAAEEYLGAERPVNISDVAMSPGDIEVIDKVPTGDKIETERFMAQMIDVVVHDSSDETDDDFIIVQVNGRTQAFLRNTVQRVRRYFVEALARSKRTTYKQRLDDRLGEAVVNVMNPRHVLNYPFTVVSDPDPRGVPWLQQVLAQRK